MALYQDSRKKGKYKLEDFDKCSSKILLARSETEDPLDLPLTSSASAEKSRGKEGKTHLEVTSLDPKVRRLGLGIMSSDPEVTGSEGKSLTIASAPPPCAPSPMGLRSGSKLCPPQKERSSSDKICSLREVPDGEGELCTFMFCSLSKTLPNARNNWAHIPRTPKNLRMNLGILALTSPSPGGI